MTRVTVSAARGATGPTGATGATGAPGDLSQVTADARYARLASANALTGVNTISGSAAAVLRIMDNNTANAAPWVEIVGDRNDSNGSGCFAGQLALARVRTDAEIATGTVLGRILIGGAPTQNDYTSANLRYAGSINGYADGVWSATGPTTPTGLRFYTGTTAQAPGTANVTAGNLLALQLDSTGKALFGFQTQVPAGSAGAPGLALAGATSGLFSTSNDVVVSRLGVERLRISSTETAINAVAQNAIFRAQADGAASVGFNATRYSADANSPVFLFRKARGSLASPLVPSNSDIMGSINFSFFADGTSPTTARDSVQIRGIVSTSGTPSETNAEGRFIILASVLNSVTPTDLMAVQHSTGLQMYGANTVIDASRHHRLRSYTVATLPTASPAGQLIYVSDGTTNKRLAVSDATNWRWPDGAIVS
jgi:hypothetical protein